MVSCALANRYPPHKGQNRPHCSAPAANRPRAGHARAAPGPKADAHGLQIAIPSARSKSWAFAGDITDTGPAHPEPSFILARSTSLAVRAANKTAKPSDLFQHTPGAFTEIYSISPAYSCFRLLLISVTISSSSNSRTRPRISLNRDLPALQPPRCHPQSAAFYANKICKEFSRGIYCSSS